MYSVRMETARLEGKEKGELIPLRFHPPTHTHILEWQHGQPDDADSVCLQWTALPAPGRGESVGSNTTAQNPSFFFFRAEVLKLRIMGLHLCEHKAKNSTAKR